MSKIDISAVINLHTEGMLAHSSFVSIARAKAFAERQGLRVEVVAVLDFPDQDTIKLVRGFDLVDILPVFVSHEDLGCSRNSGVHAVRGDWVSFLDGDDLWAENWLAAAFGVGINDPRPIILHPEVSVYFGESNRLFIHVDMEDEDFDLLGLSVANYWTALSFARRELYLSIPYPPTDIKHQIGFEDWGWNLETIAKGCVHKVVPDTVHAVRTRKDSLNRLASSVKALPASTNLFRDLISQRSDQPVRLDNAQGRPGPLDSSIAPGPLAG